MLLLKKTLERGKDLDPHSTPNWEEWCRLARSALAKVFGAGSYEEHHIIDDPIPETVPVSLEGMVKWHDRRRECLPIQLQRLGNLITLLEDELHSVEIAGNLLNEARYSSREEGNGRVVICCGHNEEALQRVISFFERHSVQPIVLYNHPSERQAIVERLESCSPFEYAVILLITDNVDRTPLDAEQRLFGSQGSLVFELGYFMGRLGRKRVCILYDSELEIASKTQDVITCVPLDRIGEWQLELARAMRTVGFGFRMADLG